MRSKRTNKTGMLVMIFIVGNTYLVSRFFIVSTIVPKALFIPAVFP